MAQIDWNEVQDALAIAGQLKNHYRAFDRLEAVISVVNRAKYLAEEAEKQQRAFDGEIREKRDLLARLTSEVEAAKANVDSERDRLAKALAAARESHTAQLSELTAKIHTANDALKAAVAAQAKQSEQAKAAAKVEADRLQSEKLKILADIARETDAARATHATVQAALDRAQDSLSKVLSGLGR